MTGTHRLLCLGAAAVVLAALGVGCGGSDRPATVPVTGTVLLDGQPLEGAALNFMPDAGGQVARAVSDASGNFTVGTFEGTDGAVPGMYKVAVVKMEASSAGQSGDPNSPPDLQLSGMPGSSEPPKMLLPARYSNANESGITVEVKDDMEPVKIELSSQ